MKSSRTCPKWPLELGAFKALGRILKALCNATSQLARANDPSKLRFVSRRCLDLAWPKHHVENNAGSTLRVVAASGVGLCFRIDGQLCQANLS